MEVGKPAKLLQGRTSTGPLLTIHAVCEVKGLLRHLDSAVHPIQGATTIWTAVLRHKVVITSLERRQEENE